MMRSRRKVVGWIVFDELRKVTTRMETPGRRPGKPPKLYTSYTFATIFTTYAAARAALRKARREALAAARITKGDRALANFLARTRYTTRRVETVA